MLCVMTRATVIPRADGEVDASARWECLGPYYAMFPVSFAREVISEHSRAGELVLDPFAGRGTSVYAAADLGRRAVGVEINRVGWLYGKAKIAPAPRQAVLDRLDDICAQVPDFAGQAKALPKFYHRCFSRDVRRFLLAARKCLDWRRDRADWTLMALIVMHLHGKQSEGMSNQMRQTKAMGPAYSIRWWRERGMETPPDIDPREFLRKKIEWRYAKGIPPLSKAARLYLGDSTRVLDRIAKTRGTKASLLFTSPPYKGVVDYHADQWLRLWLLGGPDSPKSLREKNKGRFNSQADYRAMLRAVFSKCAGMMAKNGAVYVRTDMRKFTHDCTLETLREFFPKHKIREEKSYAQNSQTRLFANTSSLPKPGEVDIIMTP